MTEKYSELDFLNQSEGGTKAKAKSKSYTEIVSGMKTSLADAPDQETKQKIINSTLDSILGKSEETKKDLLEKLKDLEDFEKQFGDQFAGLTSNNENEASWITKAENAKTKLENRLTEVKGWGDSWWNRVIRGKERKIESLTQDIEEAVKHLQNEKDRAEISRRKRLESSPIEDLLKQLNFKKEGIVKQLTERQKEIATAKHEISLRLQESNDILQQATEKVEQVKGLRSAKEAELRQAQDLLAQMMPRSPEHAEQIEVVQTLEQDLEELKKQEKVAISIANSKESFVKKHNMSIKTLTAQDANLTAYMAKLNSDVNERKKFYKAYVTMLKASSDQDVASILEEFGEQTDYAVAEDVVAMYNATQNNMYEMLKKHPDRMSNYYKLTAILAQSMSKFSQMNDELRRNFEENYGYDINNTFAKTYENPLEGRLEREEESSGGADDGDMDERDFLK